MFWKLQKAVRTARRANTVANTLGVLADIIEVPGGAVISAYEVCNDVGIIGSRAAQKSWDHRTEWDEAQDWMDENDVFADDDLEDPDVVWYDPVFDDPDEDDPEVLTLHPRDYRFKP